MHSRASVTWGLFLTVFGAGLLAWIGYNLFVERLPATEGLNPLAPSIFALALIAVGVTRIRSGLRKS